MADRTLEERLQPSLLDRLTDEAPTEKTEARDYRVIDAKRLREILRRDLVWLLNTNNFETQMDHDRYPEASKSVINYGVREVSGDFSTRKRAQMIQESIERAVELFEPRIRPGTLQVILREEETASRTTMIYFDIRADMWAQPMPLELYLRSEIDVTSGAVQLTSQG
jgi:type VI secretion system protein ImpF